MDWDLGAMVDGRWALWMEVVKCHTLFPWIFKAPGTAPGLEQRMAGGSALRGFLF